MSTPEPSYKPSPTPQEAQTPCRTYTGLAAANSRAPVAVRLERAVKHKHGEIAVVDLTAPQLAMLWRLPLSVTRKALKSGNGTHKPNLVDQQLRAFRALTPDQKRAFLHGLEPDWGSEVAAVAKKIVSELAVLADNEPDLFAALKAESV
jgi:hypothetical protein